MKKLVGIWLDRQRATVVSLIKNEPFTNDMQTVIENIESNVEPRLRLSGGSRSRKTPYGPQDIAVDGKQESRTKQQMRLYFRNIIAVINDAKKIFIMGPGETRGELKRSLEKNSQLGDRIIKVEAADKMTQNQIVAKVKNVYKAHL
ncbi:MAG: hypothetical protein JRE21_07725 [Deltaproteobacteria bacterium]|jgi:hypothetical protein|nr:hypothetical protein [Deltaproteobacteria bacterium]